MVFLTAPAACRACFTTFQHSPWMHKPPDRLSAPPLAPSHLHLTMTRGPLPCLAVPVGCPVWEGVYHAVHACPALHHQSNHNL
jgi:hypothetical protein